MPAPRLLQLLALSAAGAALAVLVPVLAGLVVAFDLLLLWAFFVDLRRARRVTLKASRKWPALLAQGETADLAVEVLAPDQTAVARLREGLHPALAPGPRRVTMSLARGKPMVWTVPLTPRRRGAHETLPLTSRVEGPWGLAWSQRELLPGETVRVYPRIRYEGKAARILALAHRRELGQAPTAFRGSGSEIYGVRSYVPGDPIGRIYWKATARHGRPISREDTWERGRNVVLLLDCGRAMASTDAGLSKLDHALGAALAMLRVAAGRGDTISVVAFTDRIIRRFRARPDAGGVARAYAALFDLEARLAEPAYDAAAEEARKVEPRRSTIVLFTSVVDLASSERLRTAISRIGRARRCLLVNLEDADVSRLAFSPPKTVVDAYAKVSALDILRENRLLATRLRRLGVASVSAPADRLTLEALEAYLRLASASSPHSGPAGYPRVGARLAGARG